MRGEPIFYSLKKRRSMIRVWLKEWDAALKTGDFVTQARITETRHKNVITYKETFTLEPKDPQCRTKKAK